MNHSPVKLFVEFAESVKQIEYTSTTKITEIAFDLS